MKGGFGFLSAVIAVAVLLLSAGLAADGSTGGCIEHVSGDGIVDDEEADRIISELCAFPADDMHGPPDVCLYSFGCSTLTVPSELFAAVDACGAGMSVETRHGQLTMAPGSLGSAVFAEGTDVDVRVVSVRPYMFYEDFAEGGLVTEVGLENGGNLSMADGMSVSVVFELDGRHVAEDLEVYYLHGDRVQKDHLEDVVCTEGCDGVKVTFGADRAGQYAVVYSEESGRPDVNPWISLSMLAAAIVTVILVANYIRKL